VGFQEGGEDESLLNCIVCSSPFGMTARFCGECGANRSQALGIERAKPSQKIRPVEPLVHATPSQVSSEPELPSIAYSATPQRKKPSRWRLFRIDFGMRVENFWFTLQYHSKKLAISGVVIFLASSYILTQNLVYLGSSPIDISNAYISAVGARDQSYFTSDHSLTPDLAKIPLLPLQFNQWTQAQTASWIEKYSWNGWFDSGTTTAQPGAGQPYLHIPLRAHARGAIGPFSKEEWALKGPMATVSITYPKNSSLPIYINGIYAGTVGHPQLAAGTYYVLPGPFSIVFARNGQSTNDDVKLFINVTGQYSV
jgi:hypothetical protein